VHNAIRAEQAGDGRAAQIFLSNATNDAPKDPAAHCSLGDFLARRGEWAEAAICYERAAMLAPRSGYILNALGEALKRSGQEQKALACFVRAGECGDGQASLESSTRQK
jgi:Tfp pilus assembly protein PilF